MHLFITKGLNGIEPGGFAGWVESEEHADGEAEGKSQQDGLGRDQRAPAEFHRNQLRPHDAQHDAGQAAGHAKRDCLDQKLPQDVTLARADSQAHADLPGSLGHADQHDIHNPNAADQQ